MGSIRHFRELDVYQLAMKASMILFELSKAFPLEEWIEFSVKSGYLDPNDADKLDKQYESIQGKLIQMLTHPDQWCIR
ncbi:MAG: four helix bundle protein [Syntrophobacteraceae bacterium]